MTHVWQKRLLCAYQRPGDTHYDKFPVRIHLPKCLDCLQLTTRFLWNIMQDSTDASQLVDARIIHWFDDVQVVMPRRFGHL